MNDSTEKKRITTGILFGVLLLFISAGIYAMGAFMVSMFVFGCRKSPPDWVYMIVFFVFPIPLIITSITAPYLYVKKQKWPWIILTIAGGIFLSGVIYLIFFIALTQYC